MVKKKLLFHWQSWSQFMRWEMKQLTLWWLALITFISFSCNPFWCMVMVNFFVALTVLVTTYEVKDETVNPLMAHTGYSHFIFVLILFDTWFKKKMVLHRQLFCMAGCLGRPRQPQQWVSLRLAVWEWAGKCVIMFNSSVIRLFSG